jgi:hypothetical protein
MMKEKSLSPTSQPLLYQGFSSLSLNQAEIVQNAQAHRSQASTTDRKHFLFWLNPNLTVDIDSLTHFNVLSFLILTWYINY